MRVLSLEFFIGGLTSRFASVGLRFCKFASMQKLKRFLGAVCFLLIAQFMFGQSTVKGFLKNKASGEPVMFASVSLEGTSFGVMTDIEGFYSISKVPAGAYRLVVSSMEFETVAEEVLLIEDRISTRNYLLESKVISLGSAEVSADRQLWRAT